VKLARTAVILSALSGGTVLAVVAPNHSRILAAQQLSDVELQSKLQAQGYSGLRDIRRNGNRVHVTVLQNGQSVRLTVDSRTGQALGERGVDDDDDDD